MRASQFVTVSENREKILAQKGIKIGGLVDLTSQFPTYSSMIGQVKSIETNGKLKIQVVHAESTAKRVPYQVGNIITMAPNYINKKSVHQVAELFEPGKNWKWEFRGSEEAFASFKIGDIEYLWSAAVNNKRNPETWTLSFQIRGQEGFDKSFGLTGTGNSTEVMSTVVDITRAFLGYYNSVADRVLELRFSSDNGKVDNANRSRTGLYARLVKRLLPDWNLHTKKVGSETDFYLTNPRAYELEEDWKTKLATGAAAAAMALSGGQLAQAPGLPTAMQTSYKAMSPKDVLTATAKAAGIAGNELAQLLSQAAHETMNFTKMAEVGTPAYFKKYEKPGIAKILGNKFAGDGEKYKGRGFIQLTGRDNYARAGKALGIMFVNPYNPKDPRYAQAEQVAAQNRAKIETDPNLNSRITIWYWKGRVASKVTDFTDTRAVTKKINPGMKHLSRRQQQFQQHQSAVKQDSKQMQPVSPSTKNVR